ncbi:acetylcholinesterase-1-like [Dermacentor andersoni]|uniref:acetylcholinesterase-1-like n=1 Tax=Dermacentor andersoni TaxID=34620 RepID=UPI002417430B|nr:cholinesterase-like [Dermacentor andersoni]
MISLTGKRLLSQACSVMLLPHLRVVVRSCPRVVKRHGQRISPKILTDHSCPGKVQCSVCNGCLTEKKKTKKKNCVALTLHWATLNRRLLSVFIAFLEAYGIQDVNSVLRHYGFDEPSVLDETLGQLFLLELARPMGDFLIHCPTLFFLEEAASVGGRAFFYEFGYSPSYRTWPAWQGVPQFIDFMFATGLLAELDAIKPVSARDMAVARDFTRIVAGFAKTGNPNVLPNMLWRRWEPSADGALVLDYDVDSAYKQGPSFPEKGNCDFWRRHFVLRN